MEFTENQTQLLSEEINPDDVAFRSGGGDLKLAYLESWYVMDECNRIFGFGGWSSETVDINCVVSEPTKVTYTAKVRITVGDIVREGVGAGHGRLKTGLGDNHESAIKEAESDARKRALISFGHQFGLSLYDKDKKWLKGKKETQQTDQSNQVDPQQSQTVLRMALKFLEKANSKNQLLDFKKNVETRYQQGKISQNDKFKLDNAIIQKEATLT